MNIAQDMTQLVGTAPLVRINRLSHGLDAEILAKLKFFSPCGSVKDRISVDMIEAAEKAGALTRNTVLVEATSGSSAGFQPWVSGG